MSGGYDQSKYTATRIIDSRRSEEDYYHGARARGVNCDEEQEQDYYINWPRERGKLQDSYSPSAEDADSLSPRTAWMKGDNSSCASHLRNDYIDSHPVTDSRQRRTSDFPETQRMGPVVPASDNPRYSMDTRQGRNKTILEVSSGYDTEDYVREPAVSTLKIDIRPDQGPCKHPNQVTIVLPYGYSVPGRGCQVRWQNRDAAFSQTTDGEAGANHSCVYAFSPEWPCPDTVTVAVEGLHRSGQPAECLDVGCFTFTQNVTREQLGHGLQCPASSSSPAYSAEEKLDQILRILGCQCKPSVTGHGVKHSTTCALSKAAKDGRLSSGEEATVDMQNHLKVMSLLESIIANHMDDDAEEMDSTAAVDCYLSVPVVPPEKHLSCKDVCSAYDDPNNLHPAVTGLVAPRQVHMPGEKFTTILEEVRDRSITLEKALEKGRTYTYSTASNAGVTMPDHASNSKGVANAGAKPSKATKRVNWWRKKQTPPTDAISTSSSETASVIGRVRPPQPPPKPKSRKPRKPIKEPDTDESTTYAVSLSSFTSRDSAEQPYGIQDAQNLKRILSEENILVSSTKVAVAEQHMGSTQTSSQDTAAGIMTSWKHCDAMPTTEQPIYMNVEQLGLNRANHSSISRHPQTEYQNAGRLNRHSLAVEKVAAHNNYTDESNSTNKQDSGSTNGADSGYNSLTTEDLLARTISPVRSPSPVYENLESLEVSHPRRPEPKPRKMSREPLKY